MPESGDWWNAGYLLVWGTNLPTTRTPDAHFMVEARYRGQKVVVVSPDYAEHVEFADHWLPARPGTDGALAMAMGHVILKEFWLDRRVPYFEQYARHYTDLPLLVTLRERGDGFVPDRFLRASDLDADEEQAEWKTVVLDERTGRPVVPNGSVGHRYQTEEGRWNLRLEGIEPALSLHGRDGVEHVAVDLPRFDADGVLPRGVPALRIGDHFVTTVLDLMLAQYGVARPELPGEWPADYDDPLPYTPAWQEQITTVDRRLAVRVAREFARRVSESTCSWSRASPMETMQPRDLRPHLDLGGARRMGRRLCQYAPVRRRPPRRDRPVLGIPRAAEATQAAIGQMRVVLIFAAWRRATRGGSSARPARPDARPGSGSPPRGGRTGGELVDKPAAVDVFERVERRVAGFDHNGGEGEPDESVQLESEGAIAIAPAA